MLDPYGYSAKDKYPLLEDSGYSETGTEFPAEWRYLSYRNGIPIGSIPFGYNFRNDCPPSSNYGYVSPTEWDIKDAVLPEPTTYNAFELWPNGDCRLIYHASNSEARKHKSGWAMRNTNNHNKMILKKSCLGVIKCSKKCWHHGQQSEIRIAPRISEAARRCQLNNKRCPNPNCNGYLIQQPCQGKSGNPVTHYWRYYGPTDCIYFMSLGIHDHERPESVKVGEKRLKLSKTKKNNDPFIKSCYDCEKTVDGDKRFWDPSIQSLNISNCAFPVNTAKSTSTTTHHVEQPLDSGYNVQQYPYVIDNLVSVICYPNGKFPNVGGISTRDIDSIDGRNIDSLVYPGSANSLYYNGQLHSDLSKYRLEVQSNSAEFCKK